MLLLVISGCTDDDAIAHDAAVMDVGLDSEVDAADAGDASHTDADVGRCVTEVVHLWPAPRSFPTFGAVRLPLSQFCRGACPTLSTFENRFHCEGSSQDGGVDDLDAGGDGTSYVTRTQGCGFVSYDNAGYTWPRHYNFNLQSGALIGAASVDDVLTGYDGSEQCGADGFVAGDVALPCSDAVVQRCTGSLD